MLKKHVFILLLVSFIPFLFYLQKPLMNGTDGYAYNSFNCSVNYDIKLIPNLVTPASKLIFSLMPCSLVVPKLIGWLLFFVCLIIFGLIGELFDKEIGWLTGIFSFLSPMMVTAFWELEEMSFGYPLIFLDIYFVLKYVNGKNEWFVPLNNERNKWIALSLILVAGLFWKGSVLFLIWSGVFFPETILLVLPLVLWRGIEIVYAVIIPNVIESLPVYGWLYLFLLNFFWFSIPKRFWKLVLPLIVLFSVSLKYTLFVVPFLLIGVLSYLRSTKNFRLWFYLLLLMSLVSLVTASLNAVHYSPTQDEINVIKFAVREADGNFIFNDWSYGYWIVYFGGKTNFFGGGVVPDYNSVEGVIVTKRDEDVRNAEILFTGNKLRVWKR